MMELNGFISEYVTKRQESMFLSDIEDNAIDYTLFNRKRKEMLTTFREIYDYIGSYKSLINAINYFGYNDLQLYEYYKNNKYFIY